MPLIARGAEPQLVVAQIGGPLSLHVEPAARDPPAAGRRPADLRTPQRRWRAGHGKLGLAASAQPTVLTVVGSQAYPRHSRDSTHRTSAWARYDLGTKKLTSLGQVDSAFVVSP
ncbi:hypothetical protein GCM10009810_16860 [Nostocoides vanveenii]|uniref:Uncharacterized protein n=1 Tax=Nostocoides vanveenii TaxID=330835 RepID=A0ABN2KLF0_9MICO